MGKFLLQLCLIFKKISHLYWRTRNSSAGAGIRILTCLPTISQTCSIRLLEDVNEVFCNNFGVVKFHPVSKLHVITTTWYRRKFQKVAVLNLVKNSGVARFHQWMVQKFLENLFNVYIRSHSLLLFSTRSIRPFAGIPWTIIEC